MIKTGFKVSVSLPVSRASVGHLMNQLVSDDTGHPLLVVGGRLVLVVQQVVLSVRDQAPVLHGPRPKVRDGDLI